MKTAQAKNRLLDALALSDAPSVNNPPRFSIAGSVVSSPGNLCVIAAHAKVGKSALVGAFLAATTGRKGDTLGVTSENPDSAAVIHFDTEQSHEDHRSLLATALRRVSLPERPAWLRSYRLAEVPVADRIVLLEHELRRASKCCGSVHSVLLDGVADFVLNPNDSSKAFAVVHRLHALAALFKTSIVCVLHLNPGKSKTRGHLGSQLERKSEANLLIEKSHGVSTVFSQSARHAPLLRMDGVQFRWNDEAQMHLTWSWNWKKTEVSA
jgi:hypothetical protein